MITIYLDSFFIGVVIGFFLSMILTHMFFTQILPKEARCGYQPIKSCKPYSPKEIVGIGSKGEDA